MSRLLSRPKLGTFQLFDSHRDPKGGVGFQLELFLERKHSPLDVHEYPFTMRQSLRRSCAACARSKSSCDLRTPRCSRCIKRQVECAYANEPSTGPATSGWQNGASTSPLDESGTLTNYRFGSLDPFDSYPQTRLPREHVQRLIYGCM